MIVIADTSPINYLILIDEIEVLPRLYGRVILPEAVCAELLADAAPVSVRNWAAALPPWIEVAPSPTKIDSQLAEELGRCEGEAIYLAGIVSADLLLIDETLGRQVAVNRGFRVIGTIGILIAAKRLGLIDSESVGRRLLKTNFHVSPKLVELLINE